MEFVERGINNVQEHMKESIQKHNEIFAKTIYDTAKKSNQCSTSLDRGFHKTFTDSNSMGVDETEPFNPKAVFEFKDGKATDVIETWDETLGILPNRKVMGNYYIDLSDSLAIKNNPNLWFTLHPQHKPKNKNGNSNVYLHDTQSSNLDAKLFPQRANSQMTHIQVMCEGRNVGTLNQCQVHKDLYRTPPLNNPIVQRGEERKFENYTGHHEFEVDNYLNLYHKQSGLYLMLHKTTFPDICFYFAKQYTQLKGKPYYKIYESKRVENIWFQLNGNYLSKDNRSNLISKINQLLPENYKHVYELYNNFRKMQPLNNLSDDSVQEETISADTDITDGKDRIIKALQTKLNETIKRSEKNEQLLTEMVEMYHTKSTDLQNCEREKHLLKDKLSELNLQLENKKHENDHELDKMKNMYENSITEIKESKDCEKIELYKRLSEAEVFRAKSEALGISYEALKANLEKETLEKKKIKDINHGLLTQFEQQKERNQKLSEDNTTLLKQLDEKVYLADECRRIMDELNCKLSKKEEECIKLGENLSQMGETSDSALENALSDRVNDLEAEISSLKQDKIELSTNNQKLTRDLEKIRGFMSSFN